MIRVTATFPADFRVRLDVALARTGVVLVVFALFIIWGARLSVARNVYVSELGAAGEPTAEWFRAALLLIVIGGAFIAWTGRHIRTTIRFLRAVSPAMTLWTCCALFLVASQVTCTQGCPIPYGPSFTWQDFIHTTIAVLAFAASCVAMLQVSFAEGQRTLRSLSLACSVTIAVVAGTGGILALVHVSVNVGSALELLATTVALAWLAAFGIAVGAPSAVKKRQQAVGKPDELVDLVLIPIDPPHSGLGVNGHEIPVLFPHDERALGT